MPTDRELWDLQSKVTAVLLERGAAPAESQLRDAARLLSTTLREIVDDRPFWAEVRKPTRADESVRLAAVLAVDWSLVFEEQGDTTADALAKAADVLGAADDALTSEHADWQLLRFGCAICRTSSGRMPRVAVTSDGGAGCVTGSGSVWERFDGCR